MTLLERWHDDPLTVGDDEIRRALAIAQAVDERKGYTSFDLDSVRRRADELLRGKR